MHELQFHKEAAFLTLTYDQVNLPKDNLVNISEWQTFTKALRKKIGPFRYLHCGEYGSQTRRPHYHAILFGHSFRRDSHSAGSDLWISPLLEEVWGKGFSPVGEVTFESCAYVARYSLKAGKLHKNPLLPKPYVSMSRRPGIAQRWIEKFYTDVYPHDHVVTRGGNVCQPPRYYDNWCKENKPDLWKKTEIKRKAKRLEAKRSDDNTPARLETIERVVERRLEHFAQRNGI